MYSSTASTKQPLQAENPYYDKKRGMPTTTRDLQAQPLQAKSKKVKAVRPKRLAPQMLPAQGQLQRAGVDAPGSLAEMPGHMQYQRLIAARAAQARRIREDQVIDEQRRLVGEGATATERAAVKERRKPQIEMSGAQLAGQIFIQTSRGADTQPRGRS